MVGVRRAHRAGLPRRRLRGRRVYQKLAVLPVKRYRDVRVLRGCHVRVWVPAGHIGERHSPQMRVHRDAEERGAGKSAGPVLHNPK